MAGHQPSTSGFASIRNWFHLIAFVLAFLFALPHCYGQASAKAADAQSHLTFKGNDRSKSDFLLRVLDVPIDADSATVSDALQNLRNLPTIIDARLERDSTGLFVRIEEGVNILPIVLFGGVEGNRWYLLGVNDLNMGGRAIQGTAFYRNIDGEHNGYLRIQAPYLGGSRWGGGVELQRYASLEPLFFPQGAATYRYINHTAGVLASYAFDFRHRINFGASYLYEEYIALMGQEPLLSGIPQQAEKHKLLLKLQHRLNRVDLHSFESNGWALHQDLQSISEFGSSEPFLMYWFDLLGYKRTFGLPGNFAARLRLGISSNRVTPFAPFVLDSQVNIRGAGNRVDRGTAVAVANLEYRIKVWEGRQFGLQTVAFSDIGNWRSPGGNLDELIMQDKLAAFTGGGLRLIWKRSFQAVLRVDYGVNTQNTEERGWVIGVGQYF
jgi:hypothetical protein